ncbi:MAG: DUF262 domain-containing protein [Chloroflexi bacterium]|nr:DUF262 domain-containing protein [Chloroflexota bacterium]
MVTSEHQISFERIGLATILKHNHLKVPPYQREYSWDETAVTTLFSDLALAHPKDYFLGTIVVIPEGSEVLQIVDGQQRLATTAIFLHAIHEYLHEIKEDSLAQSIRNDFLTGFDRKARVPVPKLTLNIDDNDLFSRIIAGEQNLTTATVSSRQSHTLLLGAQKLAAEHVRKIVAQYETRDRGDILTEWVEFLEAGAVVVLLKVADSADAYLMFETLNDRGVRTSQIDLIKTFLFGHAGERFNEVQSRWSHIRGAIETLGDSELMMDFMRHALIVVSGPVREAGVYERVQREARTQSNAVAFTSILETLAHAYVASFTPSHEQWNGYAESVRRAITVFELLNIKPMRPLILAITAKMPVKETRRAFEFLISLGVRLLIASSTRSESVERPLAEAANEIFNGKIQTAQDLKKLLNHITPKDSEFQDAFTTCRTSNAKLARYYLRSLEMTAKGELEPWYLPQDDITIINLEHIRPKKSEGNWPQFSPDEADNYVNRLGNQVLIRASDNSNLRSASFKDKVDVYNQSPYVLTNQVASVDEWNVEAIAKRQTILAKKAIETWPL